MATRMDGLGDVETIAAYVNEMSESLMESELTETRAFVRSFVKKIGVVPGKAIIRYTIPMPKDSSMRGRSGSPCHQPSKPWVECWSYVESVYLSPALSP